MSPYAQTSRPPAQLLSRKSGVEVYRLETWREKAMPGMEMSLKERTVDPSHAELDTAMKRIGEFTRKRLQGMPR